MLLELRIRDYALIEQLSVQLGPGLTVLSGETGAGKSIVVGAISLLLGERASGDLVRQGAPRAVVEGVFDISNQPRISAVLAEHGLSSEEGLLIVRREVADGRSRTWLNGSNATAGLLAAVGRELVDLHGQHEHQTLVRPDDQRRVLDSYGGAEHIASRLRAAVAGLRELDVRIEAHEERRRDIAQRSDFLRFQVDEIRAAALRVEEEEELEREAHRLEHAEDLASLAETLHQQIYGADDSVVGKLAELRRTLDQLVRFDPAQQEAAEQAESAYYTLDDLGRRMGAYASGVEFDPRRLDELRQRRDLLFRLKAKYGPAVSDVIATGEAAEAELGRLESAELDRRELEQQRTTQAKEVERLAEELTERRTAAARRLEEEVSQLLPDLGLPGGRFQVALATTDEISSHGAESVEFRAALNVGYEPRPLARVASGGELSRIMLALKTLLARADEIPTLIFDEIDAGIGGRVALQVGDGLRRVAEHHQVLVITHLAQIASRADHHFRVEKVEREGSTTTRLVPVAGADRVAEIARMLSGDETSPVGLDHARELLESRGLAASSR